MNHIKDLIPILPEIIILLGACASLMSDIFVSRHKFSLTNMIILLTIIIAAVISYLQPFNQPSIILTGHFIADHLAWCLKLFIYLSGFLTIYFSIPYQRTSLSKTHDVQILTLFSMLGMLILVSSYNLITLYMGLELLSLPLYAIVAMQPKSTIAKEAAIKFFIMGAIASGLLLYGISIIYATTGHLDIATIAQSSHQLATHHLTMLRFGLIFIITAIAFKFGAIPFHSWVADVYQGSSWPCSTLIATATKIAALGMAIRLLIDMLPGLSHDWRIWLIVIAIASIALGNLYAMVQKNIKRLLGYSSIAQIGYILLGLACNSHQGYLACIFYTLIYTLTALGIFLSLTLLSIANGHDYQQIDSLKGLNDRHPWLALMILLSLFSLAGIPPFAGFIAKVMIIKALLAIHLGWLATLAILLSTISVYYYLNIIKVMYFHPSEKNNHRQYLPKDLLIMVSLVSLLALILGIYPNILLKMCYQLV